jgi:hypothetical protein
VSTFQVTTDDLAALTAQLSALVGELGTAGQIQVDVAAAGHPLVESALESFFTDWSTGLSQVEHNLTQVSQRLGGAAGTYDHTESSVATGFRSQ